MSSDERKSDENGIWLCQTCSKLIDSDVQKYTVEKLKRWKKIAKLMAADELEKGTKNELTDDRELNVIGDMLSLLRRRLRIAKETGAYSTFGEGNVSF